MQNLSQDLEPPTRLADAVPTAAAELERPPTAAAAERSAGAAETAAWSQRSFAAAVDAAVEVAARLRKTDLPNH